MKLRILVAILIVAAIVIVAGYLNRYQYFKIGRGDGIDWEVRTNRFTNETDALGTHGWFVIQTSEEWKVLHWDRTHPLPPPEPIPTQ
jgi:hypothetical protein